MSKLLVCQHVAFEILGTLDPLLRRTGLRIRYVNFGRRPAAKPTLSGYAGLVVLGGPMSANQTKSFPHLATEMELIEDAIDRALPVLGICLGAQIIAKTLGARVAEDTGREIGWYDVSVTEAGRCDPVLRHFRDTEKVFQWHADTFDIPPGAVQLATSAECPNQAFRYGDNVYGFQFHLEVDEPLIGRWLTVPVHVTELRASAGRIDPQAIKTQTPGFIGPLKRLSNRTFKEFIKLFDLQPKRRALSSR